MSQRVSFWVVSLGLAGLLSGLAAASGPHQDLYRPPMTYHTGQAGPGGVHADHVYPDLVSYTTAAGFTRRVPIAVWIPHGATGPLPVVLWMHGGGPQSGNNPEGSMNTWSIATARAGYAVVAVTHVGNSTLEGLQMCEAIGYPLPANAWAIAAAIQDLAAQMAAGGTIDVSDVVTQHPDIFGGDLPDVAEGDTAEGVMALLLERLNGCRTINNAGLWDRPRDVQAVLDALGSIPALQGLIDLQRVVVGGHSNGSNSALQNAGLVRTLPNGVPVPPPAGAIRPMAAIGLSPMGPNEFGLFDTSSLDDAIAPPAHSWAGLDLPVFTATGDGDESCKPHRYVCGGGDSGGSRRIPFFRMPAGDKYLLYIGDAQAPPVVTMHTLFGEANKCLPGAQALCDERRRWIESAVFAFLDAYVKGSGKARGWLTSKRIERASNGIAELFRK
jgi:hypothetical protein